MALCPACNSETRCISIDSENDIRPVYSMATRAMQHVHGPGGTRYTYRLVCRNGCETTIETTVRRDDFMDELRGQVPERLRRNYIPFDEPTKPKPKPKQKPGPTDDDRKRGEAELERLGAAVEEFEP